MQTNYMLIPWDSIETNHKWNVIDTIEYKPITNAVKKNENFNFSIDYIILGLLIYNIIVGLFISSKHENVLYRKNKTIKKRQ